MKGTIMRWRELFWDEGNYFEMKGTILRWRGLFWDEGDYFEMKGTILRWRELFWDEGDYFEMKGTILRWRELCWDEGDYFEMKGTILRWRELFWIVLLSDPFQWTLKSIILLLIELYPLNVGAMYYWNLSLSHISKHIFWVQIHFKIKAWLDESVFPNLTFPSPTLIWEPLGWASRHFWYLSCSTTQIKKKNKKKKSILADLRISPIIQQI